MTTRQPTQLGVADLPWLLLALALLLLARR
jgi:MYXO-CTERM domain-containing protein